MAARSVVEHPDYYNSGCVEVIDWIEALGLGFNLGNTVKYVCRAGKKDPKTTITDLEKAKWYLERAIQSKEMPYRRLYSVECCHGDFFADMNVCDGLARVLDHIRAFAMYPYSIADKLMMALSNLNEVIKDAYEELKEEKDHE